MNYLHYITLHLEHDFKLTNLKSYEFVKDILDNNFTYIHEFRNELGIMIRIMTYAIHVSLFKKYFYFYIDDFTDGFNDYFRVVYWICNNEVLCLKHNEFFLLREDDNYRIEYRDLYNRLIDLGYLSLVDEIMSYYLINYF